MCACAVSFTTVLSYFTGHRLLFITFIDIRQFDINNELVVKIGIKLSNAGGNKAVHTCTRNSLCR